MNELKEKSDGFKPKQVKYSYHTDGYTDVIRAHVADWLTKNQLQLNAAVGVLREFITNDSDKLTEKETKFFESLVSSVHKEYLYVIKNDFKDYKKYIISYEDIDSIDKSVTHSLGDSIIDQVTKYLE